MTTKPLPEQPSLELDRKRAKRLLLAARSADPEASARLSKHHPRFRTTPTAEIAAQVKLHHAQLVVAREYGIASWPQLKAHIATCRKSERQRAAALVDATLRGDLGAARLLLAREEALARYDVFTAAACGEPERLQQALTRQPALARRAGGPIDAEPIVYACFSRFIRGDAPRAERIVACAQMLLAHGADPNAHFFEHEGERRVRQTCLYGAAGIANHAELTHSLLTAGADVNELDPEPQPGEYPPGRAALSHLEALYHASEFTDTACLALLLAARPYAASVSYCLGRALDHDNEAAALLYLQHGANPNMRVPWAHNRSHLHKAAMQGRSEGTLRAMLQHGGDLHALDARGVSAYRYAVRFGHSALVDLFEQHGADRAAATDEERALGRLAHGERSPQPPPFVPDAEVLRRALKSGDLAAITALIDAGADLEADTVELPPLHEAAYWGQAEALALLLARGAKPDSRNRYGGTPLGTVAFASRNCVDPEGGVGTRLPDEILHGDYARVAELLIAAGAPLPTTVDGFSDVVADVLRRHGVADSAPA